jgi:hypothetical protein
LRHIHDAHRYGKFVHIPSSACTTALVILRRAR